MQKRTGTKKSVILDIFNGTRGRTDTINRFKNSDEDKRTDKDVYGKLKEKLSPKLLKIHQKIVCHVKNGWAEKVDFILQQGFSCVCLSASNAYRNKNINC